MFPLSNNLSTGHGVNVFVKRQLAAAPEAGVSHNETTTPRVQRRQGWCGFFARQKWSKEKKKEEKKKKEKRKKRRRTNSWKMAEEGRGEGKEVKKKREGNFSIDDQ